MDKKFYSYFTKGIAGVTALVAWSCSDDPETNGPALSEGDEVVFSIVDDKAESRTMYSDDWNHNTDKGQALYWGNYLDTEMLDKTSDNVRVFCGQAAVTAADYKITASSQSSIAASINKINASGIQWGKQGTAHNFYAFYPASKASENLISGDNMINAEVTNGQSPIKYRAVLGGLDDNATHVVSENALQALEDKDKYGPSKTIDNTGTIVTYGQPDMTAAIMVAKTPVSAADYGQPVKLKFDVLADVLDITVNGPTEPNHLNAGSKREYIKIKSIEIRSTTGKTICGKFDLNMETGEVANITNGVDRIQLQTAQVTAGDTHYPTLYYRGNASGKKFDQLRVRAFLIPGALKNMSDLEIVISTDCGEYTKPLSDEKGDYASGMIHCVAMPYFDQPGTEFKFGSWISQLDPDIFVNELSLPGTWYSYSASAGSVKYQDLTYQQQFDAGIRAFQFHCGISASRNSGTFNYSAPYLNGTNKNVSLESVLTTLGKMISTTEEFCVVNIGMAGNDDVFSIGINPSDCDGNWLQKIAEVVNANPHVYKTEITPNTTIGEVKGQIIVHINTNNSANEKLNGSCDALISRWMNTAGKTPQTIAMKWGTWVAPSPVDTELRWCFTEADNVGPNGYATLDERKSAIENLGKESYVNYKNEKHNTWYFCAIGGYLINNTTTGAQNLAAALNPFTLQVLSNPTRQACPMGQVMMNYAGSEAYKSPDLIRTIINNNNAFVLNKKGDASATRDVKENTNSNFTNSTQGNSIK